MGDCYRFAVNKAQSYNATIVHGTIIDPATGKRILHAWIEWDGKALDWQMYTVYNKAPYSITRYHKNNKAEVHHKYTAEQGLINILKYKHYGPWEDEMEDNPRWVPPKKLFLPDELIVMLDELEASGVSLAKMYKALVQDLPTQQAEFVIIALEYIADDLVNITPKQYSIYSKILQFLKPITEHWTFGHQIAEVFWEMAHNDEYLTQITPKKRQKLLTTQGSITQLRGQLAWSLYAAAENFEAKCAKLNDVVWFDELYLRAKKADQAVQLNRPRPTNHRDFGHHVAMMALGHGVSWFDDHAKFQLKLPHIEVWYDGKNFHISGL